MPASTTWWEGIDGSRVLTLNADGLLTCRRLVDGRKVWQIDTAGDYHVGGELGWRTILVWAGESGGACRSRSRSRFR